MVISVGARNESRPSETNMSMSLATTWTGPVRNRVWVSAQLGYR